LLKSWLGGGGSGETHNVPPASHKTFTAIRTDNSGESWLRQAARSRFPATASRLRAVSRDSMCGNRENDLKIVDDFVGEFSLNAAAIIQVTESLAPRFKVTARLALAATATTHSRRFERPADDDAPTRGGFIAPDHA